jgi:hypothetical protein
MSQRLMICTKFADPAIEITVAISRTPTYSPAARPAGGRPGWRLTGRRTLVT